MKELQYISSLLLLLLIMLIANCSGSDSGSATSAATFNLTVSIDGPGAGTVTSSPAGIVCGIDCSESYPENTVVSLTASPAAGSSFTGWSSACSGTDSCTVTMDAVKSVTATFVEFSVDCSAFATYTPTTPPLVTLSAGVAATTTLIIMHGKASSPLYFLSLFNELANADYDVVAPYMPWSDTTWDGSMCEAMNYIDSLAALEEAKGNAVIVAGHSMGGAHALIYAATAPAAEVKGIIALAPGHFPHLEGALPVSVASSIAKAEDLAANGFGDQLDTFETLIPDPNAPLLTISATANHYLSYHALYQYPDINDVLPVIRLPVLWLAGDNDQLTSFYDMPALSSVITNSDYYLVSGDHLGMISNTASPIDAWLFSMGL
jgi:pimeloyl-ACP methyl ester carboxylesterase